MQLTKLLPLLALGGLLACQKPTDSVGPVGSRPLDSLSATPTAVGQPIGAPVTKTIGPSGGTMTTFDGKISLVFPAGAVKKETTITVQPTENEAINGVGMAIQLSPAGLKFEQPVTITYAYRDAEMTGASIDAMGLAYQDGRHAWQQTQFVTVDKSKKTATANVRENRLWGLMTSYKLEPTQDTVVVGDSRELTLTKTGADLSFDDGNFATPLVRVAANNDVAKLYINGVDWTSAVPKDQSWGGVRYNPQTSQILYVAPSSKPQKNVATVTVELKKSVTAAQVLLSSQLTILAENSLIINGHSYDNVTANGSMVYNQLSVTAAGLDSTGKSGQIALYVNSLAIGAHPFVNTAEVTTNTGLSVLDGAGKGDYIGGYTFYATCNDYKTEPGSIQIVKAERANGKVKVTLQISGTVVTKHSYNAETCTVTEHKTMSVSGRFTVLVRE